MKPTEEEFEAALAAVARIRQEGDPEHLAKTFAYLDYRCDILDELAKHATRFVQFGLDPHDHAMLVRAVERLREFDAKQAGDEPEEFGLSLTR